MDFNSLLRTASIDPSEVLVLRHRPTEPELRKVLPWLAEDRPEVYNAYQQTQGRKVENAFLKAKYVASFIGHVPGKALFIGLYGIGQFKSLSYEQYWKVPEYKYLKTFGMIGFSENAPRSSVLYFDLPIKDFYKEWKGKLVVGWPPPERSWWRRAHRNALTIEAIHEKSLLAAAMPGWRDIVLDWKQLSLLPGEWRSALAQWRGVYLIYDSADSKAYVGSAYGSANILGRWLNYAASGHGGNRLLRKRDPSSFSFCILERVSPDMPAAEVIALEVGWKERLHTRAPKGLNDN
jgi:hypothetical protein